MREILAVALLPGPGLVKVPQNDSDVLLLESLQLGGELLIETL